MCGDRTDARNLIGAYRHAQSCAAHKQRPVCLALRDQSRRRNGDMRVRRVLVRADTYVGDFDDPIIRAQITFERFLVFVSGIVGTDDDPQPLQHQPSLLRSA